MEELLREEQETTDCERIGMYWNTKDALAPTSIQFIGSDYFGQYSSSLDRFTVDVFRRVVCKLVSTRISHSVSSTSSNDRHGKYLDSDYSRSCSRLFRTATFADAGHGRFCEGCFGVVLQPDGITTGWNHVGGYNGAAGDYAAQSRICWFSRKDCGGGIVFVVIFHSSSYRNVESW